MSLNSPAKQERIERHLMRQRGVGVRTVSTSFGFCFGSSEPTSSKTIPLPIPPASKRRKTNLHNVLTLEPHHVSVGKQSLDIVEAEPKQVSKKRTRRVFEEVEDKASRKHNTEAEDSFVAEVEARRPTLKAPKKQKVASSNVAVVQSTDGGQTGKARPRRRAAAAATLKVTDGFVEENMPVDKKRRPPGPESKNKRTGRKGKAASEKDDDDVALALDPGINDLADGYTEQGEIHNMSGREALAQLDKVDAKMKEASTAEEVVTNRQRQPAKSRNPTSRKRKVPAGTVEPATITNTPQESEAFEDLPDDHNAVKTVQNKLSEAPAAKNMLPKRTVKPKRRPLGETDINITLRSNSPEKRADVIEKAPLVAGKREPASTSPAEVGPAAKRPVRPRKMQVQRDRQELKSATLPTVAPALHVDAEELVRDAVVGPKATSAKPSTLSERQSGRKDATAKDDNIDWLFEKQGPKQRPAAIARSTAQVPAPTRKRTKMVDIDLDDLLSNIASFAQTQTRGGAFDSVGAKQKSTSMSRGR